MARLVSSELGEEEIEESRENYSYGANSIRDGISLGNQRSTRPIVAYPEILELKDLACFLRLPGDYPVTKLSLVLASRSMVAKGFIERPITQINPNIPLTSEGSLLPIDEEQAPKKAKKEFLIDYLE